MIGMLRERLEREEMSEEDREELGKLFEDHAADFKIVGWHLPTVEIAGQIEDRTESGWEMAQIANDDARFLTALEVILRAFATMTPKERRLAYEDILPRKFRV
jgi:hypothetical protein